VIKRRGCPAAPRGLVELLVGELRVTVTSSAIAGMVICQS